MGLVVRDKAPGRERETESGGSERVRLAGGCGSVWLYPEVRGIRRSREAAVVKDSLPVIVRNVGGSGWWSR
jgi:hypothetical protein